MTTASRIEGNGHNPPPIGYRLDMSRVLPVPAYRLLAASGLLDPPAGLHKLCWTGTTGRQRIRRLSAEFTEWWPDKVAEGALQVWRLTGEGVEGRLELVIHGEVAATPAIAAGRLGPGLSDSLRMGVSAERHVPVDETNYTHHLGDGRRLLATPDMIGLMEHAGADLLQPYLLDGFGALGACNDIVHSRPAFFGETVRYRAVLVGAKGPRVIYAVTAAVGDRLVGHGRHESHVVRLNVDGR